MRGLPTAFGTAAINGLNCTEGATDEQGNLYREIKTHNMKNRGKDSGNAACRDGTLPSGDGRRGKMRFRLTNRAGASIWSAK